MRYSGFFVLAATLAISTSVIAQSVPSAVQPGREKQLFSPPVTPQSKPRAAPLELPEMMASAAANAIHLHLSSITVEGSTAYTPSQLEALGAGLIGKDITAAQIYALAARISAKYGQDGYLVARTVIVPQAVNPAHAAIRLKVIEGYVESVQWPAAASNYPDLSRQCRERIVRERPARTATIERCLLLASDPPGLTFSSTLRAGKNPDGGIDLLVAMQEKPYETFLSLDNHGAKGRGPWEGTASITENNRLGLYEAATLSYSFAVPPKELQYISGSYHQLLTGSGLAFELDGSYSRGYPGLPTLQALNFKGTSSSFDAGLSYPLIRSRERNLRVSALFFAEGAKGMSLGSVYSNDRLRGFRLRADFDEVDTGLGTIGQSQVIVTLSKGIDGLGSTKNGNPEASIAAGRVDFTKLEINASRTQLLGHGFSLYGAFYGQWSSTALLSSEQCGYGGRGIGRAFDPDELSGDRCFDALAEFRYDLPTKIGKLTQTQLYAFADHGDVRVLDAAASTPAHQSGTSVGLGTRLAWDNRTNLDLEAAKPVSGRTDKAWRFFVALTAQY